LPLIGVGKRNKKNLPHSCVQSISIEDILSAMVPMNDYDPGLLYFSFTANNYRVKENKTDGNRPIAVSISWDIIGDKLSYQINTHDFLEFRSKELKIKLDQILCQLGKKIPSEIIPSKDLIYPSTYSV
jgi:hypothetical protein